MRATREKRPEKDTATTAREDDQEGSPSGAPSAEGERSHGRAGRRLLRPPPPAPSPPAGLRAGHAPAQAPPSRTPGPASEAPPLLRDPTPAETLPGPEQVGARGGRGGRACSPVSSHWAPLCPHPEDIGLTSQLSLPTSSLWGFTDTPLQGQGLRNVGDPLQVSLRFWSPRLAPLPQGLSSLPKLQGWHWGRLRSPGAPGVPGRGRGACAQPCWVGRFRGWRCPSAPRQPLGSWETGPCGIRPVRPLRTGTLLSQGAAVLAGRW